MFHVYEQRWNNGRVSQHRNWADIGEFGLTNGIKMDGPHKQVRVDERTINRIGETLGVWK